MAGRTFQRGQRWWIAYYAPDAVTGKKKEIRESAGATLEEAVAKLEQRLRELANAKDGLAAFTGPKMEKLLVREILDDHLEASELRDLESISSIRTRVNRHKEYWKRTRALALKADAVRKYQKNRLDDGAAPATVNRETEVLRNAFTLAYTNEKIARLPAFPRKLTENNARRGFFNRADFLAVLEHLNDADLSDYLQFFFWSGMRPKEIRSLTWSDYVREGNVLRLHGSHAKTNEPRLLSLVGPIQEIFNRRLKARCFGVDTIFHRRGKAIQPFYDQWHKACAAAGVSGRLPYDLRRTAVRNLIRAGVSQATAMTISGHKTDAMFRRYNIIDEDDVKAALEAAAAYVSTLPTKPKTVTKVDSKKA